MERPAAGVKASRTSSFVKQQQAKLADQMASSDNWHESGSGLSQLEKARKRPPRPPPQPPLPSQNSTVQRKMSALEETSASPPPENTALSGFGKRPAKPPPGPPWQSQNSTESPETESHTDTSAPPSPVEKTEQSFTERAEKAVSSFGKPPAKPPHVQQEPSQNSTGLPETSSVTPSDHVETLAPVTGPLEPSGPSNGPLVETETPGPSIEVVKCRPVNHIGKVKVVKYFIHSDHRTSTAL